MFNALYEAGVTANPKTPANLFSDLKVVDFASYIAGPAAATILSDFGAEVLKVEPPGTGDPYRYLHLVPPNPASKADYAWQVTNRNKRSIALDLKSPRARDVVARLVRWADVVVINFPPKVRERLGLTYEELAPLNPRLIYADLSGYGANGAEANKPGFDITAYWARTGHMQATRDGDSAPAIPVPGIGDHATASTLYAAIVTGLYRRERTGEGSHVGTSLIATGAWAAATWIEAGLNSAQFRGGQNRKHPANALINTYRTQDDRWLMLMLMRSKDWIAFAHAMGLTALLDDPRFADDRSRIAHADVLVGILDEAFATRPLAHWKRVLDAGNVIHGVVQSREEIVNDPQMYENDIYVPLAEPTATATHTVNSPLQIASVPKVAPRRAPRLGEHSRQVLGALGYAPDEIAALVSSGVVATDAAGR